MYEALTGIAGANFTIDPKQVFTPGEGNTLTVEEIERKETGYLAKGIVKKVPKPAK